MAENKKCDKQGCTGDCSSCASAKKEPTSFLEPLNEYSRIKKVIGIVSGKGGVGKSLVTGGIAAQLAKEGYKVGILDADITGPSIPKMFGINTRAMQNDLGILPAETDNGIKIMSINMLLEDIAAPVVWRGPVIAGAVKQFWSEVYWGELDYLLIDCPPGTGDVPLTVFQSIPLDGVVIVTSPQDLVSLIVKKAYNMAKMMNIPVIGIAENMSYVKCPNCDEKIHIFGTGKSESIADELGVELIAKIPMDRDLAVAADNGAFHKLDTDYFKTAAEKIK